MIIAATQTGLAAVIIAPIAGIAGICVGWYLNRLGEDRRRRWQLEDDQARWKREREDELHRWSWERRREAYSNLIASGRRVIIVSTRLVLIEEPSKIDSLAQVAKDVVELAHTLDTRVSGLCGGVQVAEQDVWE
jgi:hypothetical protein